MYVISQGICIITLVIICVIALFAADAQYQEQHPNMENCIFHNMALIYLTNKGPEELPQR